jgi:hypothetical protein
MPEAIIKKFDILTEIEDQFRSSIKLLYIFKDYWDENKSNIFIVTVNDKVYAFGSNERGVLGLGHNDVVVKPTLVPELCSKGLKDFRNGYQHVIALTSDGKVYCWGFNEFGELGVGDQKGFLKPSLIKKLDEEKIVEISCGSGHSVVLDSNGKVYAWGHNGRGQIGARKNSLHENEPTKVEGFGGEKVMSISCGDKHTIALTENGRVFSWGDNDFGQLGASVPNKSNSPIEVLFSKKDQFSIRKISSGSYHNLALSNKGSIYVFGNVNFGQISRNENPNSFLPKKLKHSKKFTYIASHPHYCFSFALSENGIYHIWGSIGGKVINEPEKIEVESFQDAFASYLQITESAIHFKHKEILVPNGKYSEYFKEISLLGKGSYGIVWRVKFLPDGKFFAVKKILAKDENVQDQAKELATSIWFLELRSEFIVNYYDVWYENNPDVNGKYNTGKSTIFIQMDLCEKSLNTLKNELHSDSNFKISKSDKLTKLGYFIFCELFIEILEGVEYLHWQNIIHRNLRLDNILIHNGRNNTFVKIADFGLSKGLRIGKSNTTDCGTPGYMAPEVISTAKYDTKADIYSLGVILEDLLCIDLNE